MADLEIVALPRIIFGQRDGSSRMAVKRAFFRTHVAYHGRKRELSYSPSAMYRFARQVKRVARQVKRGHP